MPNLITRAPWLLVLALMAGCASSAEVPDPTRTDGDKYKVVLENEQVRVLEYRDVPSWPRYLPACARHDLAVFRKGHPIDAPVPAKVV